MKSHARRASTLVAQLETKRMSLDGSPNACQETYSPVGVRIARCRAFYLRPADPALIEVPRIPVVQPATKPEFEWR